MRDAGAAVFLLVTLALLRGMRLIDDTSAAVFLLFVLALAVLFVGEPDVYDLLGSLHESASSCREPLFIQHLVTN